MTEKRFKSRCYEKQKNVVIYDKGDKLFDVSYRDFEDAYYLKMKLSPVIGKLNELSNQNNELNTFKQKTLDLIDQKLEENPYLTLTEKWNSNCNNYESCRKNHEKNVAYGSKHMLLKELEKELKEWL